MRIGADGAKGELGHVGLGEDDGAAGTQPAYDRRIGNRRRRLLGKNFRAGAGRLAGDIEQILDADDHAVKRAERDAESRPRIGGVGGRTRRLRIDRETGAHPLTVRLGNAEQRMFETIAAGKDFHRCVLLLRRVA